MWNCDPIPNTYMYVKWIILIKMSEWPCTSSTPKFLWHKIGPCKGSSKDSGHVTPMHIEIRDVRAFIRMPDDRQISMHRPNQFLYLHCWGWIVGSKKHFAVILWLSVYAHTNNRVQLTDSRGEMTWSWEMMRWAHLFDSRLFLDWITRQDIQNITCPDWRRQWQFFATKF